LAENKSAKRRNLIGVRKLKFPPISYDISSVNNLITPVKIRVLKRFQILQTSMLPYLQIGDRILALKRTKPPERGDVVFFKVIENKYLWIKRVIGLPGETINIIDGKVRINGQNIQDYANDPAYLASFGPVQIPSAHYFLLGDHRSVVIDSRKIGPIPLEDIYYKAFMIYRPLCRIKFLP
jgi:signal peptidase I